MQNCFDLIVVDVMPTYLIMPRYSHNYALFYQLLDSNLFTHQMTSFKTEASSENYGPGVYFPSYLIFQHLDISIALYFTLHLYFSLS